MSDTADTWFSIVADTAWLLLTLPFCSTGSWEFPAFLQVSLDSSRSSDRYMETWVAFQAWLSPGMYPVCYILVHNTL